MGMFDYVNFKTQCPKCGADVDDFQSKDGPCVMTALEPQRTRRFYAPCSECKAWVEYTRPEKNEEPIRGTPWTHDEVIAMGFTRTVEER